MTSEGTVSGLNDRMDLLFLIGLFGFRHADSPSYSIENDYHL
ncbi:hypothetical protein VXF94_06485 [Bacillus amyloliquefaciens]